MKPREMLTALREYPELRADLKNTRSQLERTRQALEQSEEAHEKLGAAGSDTKRKLDAAERRGEALSAALASFCPKLSTADDMRRFYECVEPYLDADGFKLYRAAEGLTGFDLYGTFCYEDARGMFEEADGHQLLRYLIAGHFHAVDWSVVPGTCYEAATLREVDTTTPEYQAFELELYEKVLEQMGVITVETSITEIDKDTFWTLIAQAKARCGQDMDASAKWVEGELLRMGPEQALNFGRIMHGYSSLAYKYGLWTAACVMLNGCSDDGFTDFRNWLIAQGKDVYLAALKDPDSLADVPVYGGGCFESLAYIGEKVYEELTGKSAYDSFDRAAHEMVKQELAKDIEYGDGIDYPYRWSVTADYLPRLCEKYLTPEDLSILIECRNDTWNPTSPEVQQARQTASKGKKAKHQGGDAR